MAFWYQQYIAIPEKKWAVFCSVCLGEWDCLKTTDCDKIVIHSDRASLKHSRWVSHGVLMQDLSSRKSDNTAGKSGHNALGSTVLFFDTL